MWKAALAGAGVAISVIAMALFLGCDSFFAASVCRARQAPIVETAKSPERHRFLSENGVPEPYRGRANPLKRSIGNIIEGARLYDLRCAGCHGVMGIGDGEGGADLPIAPADLSASLSDRTHGDDYLLWTIAEGGNSFGTDMPTFKSDLSEREIWKVIHFLRATFDESNPDPVDRSGEP